MDGKLSDTIRIGKIVSINESKCTARVTFEDKQSIVSGDLFIIVPFALKDKAYYMPSIGERVLCIFDTQSSSVGYIIGSFYSDARKPIDGDKNKTYMHFEDNTTILYDKKEHKLEIDVPSKGIKSVEINAANNIEINCGADIKIRAAGKIDIESIGNMTLVGNTINLN